MKFLSGTYQHATDEKNRIILPARLREVIGNTVFINLGLDKCISIYSEEEYEKKVEEISARNDFEKGIREFKRIFFANTFPGEIDKQGRLPLPKSLLEKCGIKKDVYVIGSFDHIEIWDKEVYEQIESMGEASYETNASLFANKGE
ncbi:MAG: division/cell wall cluster transcriptional repressor MraZ [Bacillales bacterium]|nr:division/cell wall cluster transcriptional repressor MraZ [Bacillales bacterium]